MSMFPMYSYSGKQPPATTDDKVICTNCGREFKVWSNSPKTVECPHCGKKQENPNYKK